MEDLLSLRLSGDRVYRAIRDPLTARTRQGLSRSMHVARFAQRIGVEISRGVRIDERQIFIALIYFTNGLFPQVAKNDLGVVVKKTWHHFQIPRHVEVLAPVSRNHGTNRFVSMRIIVFPAVTKIVEAQFCHLDAQRFYRTRTALIAKAGSGPSALAAIRIF